MKVLLVARDNAPSQALGRVELELKSRGIFSLSWLGYGKPLPPLYPNPNWVLESAAEVVLSGLSSSAELAKEELDVGCAAAEANIPFGFYADSYGSVARPWFAELRDKTSFIFVINETEAKEAKNLFPNAEVVVSGNPIWEDFCFPKYTRKEVRGELGVDDRVFMVLAPGGKSAVVNILHWGGIIEAVHQCQMSDKKCFVIIAHHPGDPTPLELYQDLIKYSSVPARIVTKDVMSGPEMIPGADVIVESASTVGIEAAHQRIPVVDYFTEIALSRLEEATGSRIWAPCDLAALGEVHSNPKELASVLAHLARFGLSEYQLDRLEKIYPRPAEKGAAVKKIVETLKKHAR